LNINAGTKNEDGQTPLSLAARGGHSDVVEQLCQRKDVDINSKDNNGRTPLSHAAAAGDEITVDLLLRQRRIEADLKDNNGRTPLSWAATNSDNVLALFLRRNDDIGSKDNNGQTALDWARNQGSNGLTLFAEWPDIECHYEEYYWKMRNCYYGVSDVLRKARKKANALKRLGRGKNFASTGGKAVRIGRRTKH